MNRLFRGLGTIVLIAVVALLPPTGRAAPKLETVTYGLVSWNPFHWVTIVGLAKGHFERHGVKVDIPITGSSGAAVQAMIGGSLNMTSASPGAAFLAQDKVPELKQVVSVYDKNPYSLVVTPEIKKIDDLRGKVMGGTGVKVGADTETMRVLLHRHGFDDPRDYTVAPAGSVRERTQAMMAKTIAGVMQMEPYTLFLKEKGMIELARAADYPNLKVVQMVSIVAMKSWYTANEDKAVRFVKGYADATDWLNDPRNKTEAIKILAERMKVDEKYAAAAYKVFIEDLKGYPVQGRFNMEAMRQAAENMKVIGGTPPADVSKYIDTVLLDKAFR